MLSQHSRALLLLPNWESVQKVSYLALVAQLALVELEVDLLLRHRLDRRLDHRHRHLGLEELVRLVLEWL